MGDGLYNAVEQQSDSLNNARHQYIHPLSALSLQQGCETYVRTPQTRCSGAACTEKPMTLLFRMQRCCEWVGSAPPPTYHVPTDGASPAGKTCSTSKTRSAPSPTPSTACGSSPCPSVRTWGCTSPAMWIRRLRARARCSVGPMGSVTRTPTSVQ